ncbi:ATP-dependent DNA helicase, RecQ family [Cellulomonas flavigena DSM 20109]|uniref:ATP-dependent DNA helicase RecQ n=1 Tax=Cellulomonas flavigena (strain ATCC 482 / DSM 20109 / BCRC 11376 / JCM 18109 / NBRC 3775 / NCIMB 8073 / NRS 134) TaxID=446466 RepID=D5UBQ4_CELFN|nr:RecQ family ATP-dependent DNA helicase [Cellulomonas flavigena]ADG74149.1 ATP-dependent DNA helicase, RecQ family [Cellulomonas flavigena DSM 20109]
MATTTQGTTGSATRRTAPTTTGGRAGATLEEAVERVLGEGTELRQAQRDALRGLTAHDTLLVARTGAGKTAVYAIATLLAARLTVVVSPLIALQRDQERALAEAGLRVASVSSARTAAQQREALEAAASGGLDVLLLGPEQLQRDVVRAALGDADVGLVVVDEAHCVAEWGHDFRPDYLLVGGVVQQLGAPRVLALTATASTHVRDEIVGRLGMRDARVLVHDADRPNIWLGARYVATQDERDAVVRDLVAEEPGAVVVYARTRAHCEQLAALIAEVRPASVYHAGLPAAERARVQDRFLGGEDQLVVATSAFGMGVDRPDVRLVVHAGAPATLDQYYQEVGRAGRDEEPARGVVVVRAEDHALSRYQRASGGPRPATLRRVLAALAEEPGDVAALVSRTGLGRRTVARAVGTLQHVAAVRDDGGRLRLVEGVVVRRVLADVQEAGERRARLETSRVELVRTYTDTTDCRRRLLLELLGEERRDTCERCDSCEAGTSLTVSRQRLRSGQQVEHREFGPGTVSVVEAERVTVLFEDRGYVTLDTQIALDSELLTLAAS